MSSKRPVRRELVCLLNDRGLDICLVTDAEAATRLLASSGGLKGLAARTESLGVAPQRWSTRPLG